MIRKTWNKDKWLLTSQAEHARLSAIFASSWKFPGEKASDEVIKAIMGHDDGWKDHDALPQVKPNGDPRDFMEMKLSDSTAIFDKSIELRREAGQLYGTALVSGHFISLVESADLTLASTEDAKTAGRFIARHRLKLAEIQGELEKTEEGREQFKRYNDDLRLLRVCDYLSLLLCGDFTGETVIENVPFLENGDKLRVTRKNSNLALSVSPLPFKKNVRDHLTAWNVPNVPYESSEELAAAMAEVKTCNNEVHLGSG